MKKAASLFFLILFCPPLFGQNYHEIDLINENINIKDRKFFVDSIIDKRNDKSKIGIVQKGIFNKKHPARFHKGLTKTLSNYFENSLPKTDGQVPVVIKIYQLQIAEKTAFTTEYGFADLSLAYYYNNIKLFENVQKIDVKSLDVTQLHEENIRKALKRSLNEFNEFYRLATVNGEPIPKNKLQSLNEKLLVRHDSTSNHHINEIIIEKRIRKFKNKNVFAVGYQIGGYTLIGIDYEVRIDDFLGLHLGAGFFGYTAGIKIHTTPLKNSPFFNINFKDGGFGLINVAGVEFGGRWVFSKKSDFGLHYQVGFVKILSVKKEFEEDFFNDGAPEGMLSMGIGFSW